MRAPGAQRRLAGPPVSAVHRTLDGEPQGLDLALHGPEVVLVRFVAQHHTRGQVHELEHGGQLAVHVPEDQRVEAHLEHRPRLESRARRLARLVVHDTQLPGGRSVEPIHEAPQNQPRREFRLDPELAAGRFEARGILHREVGLHEVASAAQPLGRVAPGIGQHAHHLGALLHELGPLWCDEVDRRIEGPPRGREVIEGLEHGMHQRPADRGGARRLGQPVEHPEAVQQRAGLEVQGARGRQRAWRPDGLRGIGHGSNLRAGSDNAGHLREAGAAGRCGAVRAGSGIWCETGVPTLRHAAAAGVDSWRPSRT